MEHAVDFPNVPSAGQKPLYLWSKIDTGYQGHWPYLLKGPWDPTLSSIFEAKTPAYSTRSDYLTNDSIQVDICGKIAPQRKPVGFNYVYHAEDWKVVLGHAAQESVCEQILDVRIEEGLKDRKMKAMTIDRIMICLFPTRSGGGGGLLMQKPMIPPKLRHERRWFVPVYYTAGISTSPDDERVPPSSANWDSAKEFTRMVSNSSTMNGSLGQGPLSQLLCLDSVRARQQADIRRTICLCPEGSGRSLSC